jgi:hypothetical protein
VISLTLITRTGMVLHYAINWWRRSERGAIMSSFD